LITITCSRLQLRSLSLNDAALLRLFEMDNREHFERYASTSEKDRSSLQYWEKKVSEYLKESERGRSVRLAIFDKNSLEELIIGVCNFTQIFLGPFQSCYLGYKIDRNYEGKGLMYEALKEACGFMFKEQNLHRIMANYIPSNKRSEKLLNRLDFQNEGYAKEYLFINGVWEDHILTSLTNSSWKLKQ